MPAVEYERMTATWTGVSSMGPHMASAASIVAFCRASNKASARSSLLSRNRETIAPMAVTACPAAWWRASASVRREAWFCMP